MAKSRPRAGVGKAANIEKHLCWVDGKLKACQGVFTSEFVTRDFSGYRRRQVWIVLELDPFPQREGHR